ncbi:MAG TPA: hypothetical protein VGO71_10660 [Baekduia sp.]|jgi:hypothetical protein|nr:hypothetical protein [Baekduia sp.]
MPRFPKRLLALGGLAAGAAALRKRRAGRPDAPAPSPSGPSPGPTASPVSEAAAAPPAATGSAPPVATAGATATAPIVAPPPVEAPGPSVTPPGRTYDIEEVITLDEPVSGDSLVDEEERLAAAEAGGIGGPGPDDAHGDPAMEAVYEGGGGEAEGFELSEEELIENATHGDGRAEPIGDAFTPEIESDEATAVDAEADEEKVSEVVSDPSDEDGENLGPGVTHER